MLSNNRILRLALLLTPMLALAIAGLVLAFGPGTGHRAQADAPHAGLDFSLAIDTNMDGTNDCGTGAPSAVGDGAPDTVAADVTNTTCNVANAGDQIQVNVYLMSAGGIAYAGQTSQVLFTGITSDGPSVPAAAWQGCVFAASASQTGLENVGCAIGLPPAAPVTNLGLMTKWTFHCAASGEIHLGHGPGETGLTDFDLVEYREAGPDSLNVSCGGGPAPTDTPAGPTNTPPPPTNTPVATTPAPTNTPGQATNTPTRTNTPVPTNTPTPGGVRLGDVNGDGHVTSTDGLWILWKEAHIVDRLPMPANGDVNHDGTTNAVDALFILWIEGGRIPAP